MRIVVKDWEMTQELMNELVKLLTEYTVEVEYYGEVFEVYRDEDEEGGFGTVIDTDYFDSKGIIVFA